MGLALRVAGDEGGTQTLGRQRHSMSEQACVAGGVRAPRCAQVRRAEIDTSREGRNGEERNKEKRKEEERNGGRDVSEEGRSTYWAP
jgi:hypothetical protein